VLRGGLLLTALLSTPAGGKRHLPSRIGAVLFDWGHTLMDWTWDEALLDAGHRAGLQATGRDSDIAEALTQRRRAEALLSDWDAPEEVEYAPLLRVMLADVGVDLDDQELDRFLVAEHEAWAPARRLAGTSHALLDSLRGRGLKTGLVSNAMDPPWLLHRDLDEQDLTSRLDVIVFSSEVGIRKPGQAIFLRALEGLGVPAERTLFVGDRLTQDVRGPRDVGMKTAQAMWFRAEESQDGIEPDFQAFTMFDVLTAVRRLT
jgi:putative hydrolase of the HAD superfamily